MKKKVIKKKVIVKKVSTDASKDVEMPMARMEDADDVEEDYKVIDMSDIAAPVIEFELPNLVEREVKQGDVDVDSEVEETVEEKVEKKKTNKKVVAKKTPKTEKKGEKEALTAEKLNNELVRMRASIMKGRSRLIGKLVRQKKQLESKKGGDGTKKEEVQRKVERLGEEIVGLKTIDKDTVAKFAALNTKTLEELKIDGKTPVAERLMYKLACQDVVVEAVNSFREKYIEWNKTAAFFMQRLGLQYSNKPDKKTEKKKDEKDEEESSEVSGEESAEESAQDEESGEEEEEDAVEGDAGDYNESDVEMVDSDEDAGAEAAQKRRNLLLGLIGVKEDKARPALKPKKRKIEDDGDDAILKKSKAKETVKNELKQVLEKELKTKEVRNPKQQAKQGKKAAAQTKKTDPVTEKVEEPKEETPIEDESDLTTLVMKVDLSKGGKIAKSATKIPVTKSKVESPESESDEESNAFFLPKTTDTPKKAKIVQKKAPAQSKTKSKAPEKNKEPEAAPPVEKKKGSSKNKVTSGEVHPSWAASQLKKKEMQAAKPCGKKITFGEDDD